jgi:hypothetical protein
MKVAHITASASVLSATIIPDAAEAGCGSEHGANIVITAAA